MNTLKKKLYTGTFGFLENINFRLNFCRLTARTSLFAVQLLLFSSPRSAVAYLPSLLIARRSFYNTCHITNINPNSFYQNNRGIFTLIKKQYITQNSPIRVRSDLIFAASCQGDKGISSSTHNIVFQRTEREFHHSNFTSMPRGVKKENLPSKVCVTCGRPFTWRKKWERVWDEVTTCSKSCNRKRKESQRNENKSDTKIIGGSLLSETVTESETVNAEITSEQNNNPSTERPMVATENDDSDKSIVSEGEISFKSSLTETDEDMMGIIAQLEIDDDINDDPVERKKAERKAAKKAKKAERRAQREGRGNPSAGQKNCDMCSKSVDLLIRCTYDASGEWRMVCGSCWKTASGGVVDGDAAHPHYRYGGLWKNRRAQK